MKRILRTAIASAAAVSLTLSLATPADAQVNRPVDDTSSIKPMLEFSSPSYIQENSSTATDEELRQKWEEAVRMGHIAPLIEAIYGLDINDDQFLEDRVAANAGKFEQNHSANAVLGSSMKWDAARGYELGNTLNWLIALGVITAAVGGAVAAYTSGVFG
ncbi:hypothetical protein KBX19_02435 [Corynebacterium sp. CCUG 71335]|uniref:hypothetical protein n=1 Tax=unclassified Corynebacterium TaxID=2624378 RepID=UPI00210E61FA|nr:MULTISPECIES: hypothetical protein [unclassified Corynebacterium]MCQ4620074.1 hypothetical protein [Corynebacterium sp. CCUG 71335]MCQ4624346.1 hypothetical protein [Corynebacterium sp. CCUG 69979]MCQ4626870.1 hypothetical protein [Corynebacterium sp. CCUG 65737]